MSQNGKGSKRRTGKPGAYARGYEAIDWSKGRKPAPPRKVDLGRVLIADGERAEWIIPPLEELLGPSRYGMPDPEVVAAVEGSPVEELTVAERRTLDEMARRQQEDAK